MKTRRTLTIQLTEDQAETLNALGFLQRRSWTKIARQALTEWLDAEAHDPHVQQAKRAVHIHRSGLTVVPGGDGATVQQ